PSTRVTAFTDEFTASIRARWAVTTSTLEKLRLRMPSASSEAPSCHSCVEIIFALDLRGQLQDRDAAQSDTAITGRQSTELSIFQSCGRRRSFSMAKTAAPARVETPVFS